MDGSPFVDRAIANVGRAFFIALGAVFSVAFGMEVGNQAPVVEITVPQELNDRGYTPPVVASRILSEWQTIARVAETTKTAHNTRVLATDQLKDGEADLPLPGVNLSVNSLADYFKGKLGIHQDRLRGSIVISELTSPECAADRCYTFFLTLNGQQLRTLTVPRTDFDQMLQRAARMMVEQLDPYVLDNYYWHSDPAQEPQRIAELQRLTAMLVNSPSPDDRAWANALQGVMLNHESRWPEAIRALDVALHVDPNNASWLNSRCWAKAHIPSQTRSAIADCRLAASLNPRSEDTLDSLAFALQQDGQIDLAYKTILCAERLSHKSDIETSVQRIRALNPHGAPPTVQECQPAHLENAPQPAGPPHASWFQNLGTGWD